MKFFKTIQDSIYSPKFYSAVLTKSFKSSLGYFLLLALVLTIINLIPLIKPFFVELPNAVDQRANQILDCYPKELEIKVSAGQVSLNKEEPYFITSCEGDKSQKLVVIDTKTSYSTSQFDTYKVFAWVTKDSVIFKKSDLETRTYSLSKVNDLKLNKDFLDSLKNKFYPYLKFLGPIFLFFTFLGIFLSFNFRLLHLLLLASLIWLLGKLFKKTVSYGQSYKLGLHAITLGLIVDLVANLTGRWTYFYGFPFMVSVLTLGVVVVNFLLPKNVN